MATLYVENIPDDLYEALRNRAKSKRRSIAAEVLALLEENVPTEKELKTRHEFYRRIIEMRERSKELAKGKGPFPSTEEMIREDRER
jgi:plasmid stability protein